MYRPHDRVLALAFFPNRIRSLLRCGILACGLIQAADVACGDDPQAVKPTLALFNSTTKDQDDLCIWRDCNNPARSLFITSDKSANSLFVYDLDGALLQTIAVPKPGNIDIRQDVQIDDRQMDLVVVNQRAMGFKLCVFAVERESQQLRRLDNDMFQTGPNYGGCLYLSHRTGKLYFICTSSEGTVEQHLITGDGQGGVQGSRVRHWPLGKCESAVADDNAECLYISEEAAGIWKFAAEPDAAVSGELIVKVGESGLKGDVEGLALAETREQGKILVVSDQGRSRFMVFQRKQPFAFLGEFSLAGATDTDGIDIVTSDLGPKFPQGVFACHTDQPPRAMQVAPLADVLAKVSLKPVSEQSSREKPSDAK